MDENITDWKLNIQELIQSNQIRSEQYTLNNLKYYFCLNNENKKTLNFYFHYAILDDSYNAYVIICIKNQDEQKNYKLEISFPIKSDGKTKIKLPINLDELIDPKNRWIHDNDSLYFSIVVKTEDLINLLKQNFKMTDYNLDQYYTIDIFSISNIRNNISQRISSSYQFGKGDEISFYFEGKSNPEQKIQLDLVFSDLKQTQIYSVFLLFQNRDSHNSKYIYENIPFSPENMRHSFIFDITESEFNERNGWIFRGVAQFQFKIANFEFSEFPEKANFIFHNSSEHVGHYNNFPSYFDMFASNNHYLNLSRIRSNAQAFGHFNHDHDILNSNYESDILPQHTMHYEDESNHINDSSEQFPHTFLNHSNEGNSKKLDDEIDDDIKKKSDESDIGLAGLQNQGATCYLNSAIQLLFHIPAFRKVVYQMKIDENSNLKSDKIALSLQKLFIEMQVNNHGVCSTSDLTKSFGWSQIDLVTMHDVQEFIRTLIDSLENAIKGTPIDGEIAKIFRGKSCTVVKAPQVNYESSKNEYFYDLPIDVRGSLNLEESLTNFLMPEQLDGNNKYVIEGFGPQKAEMHTEFVEYPAVLQIHLKRFIFDHQTQMESKINDRFEFPSSIDLTPYLSTRKSDAKSDEKSDEKNEAPDDQNKSDNIYDLYCILVHEGFAQLGHYYAFIRHILNSDSQGNFTFNSDLNDWFKFNDSFVTKSSYSEAVVNNYGGSYIASSGANSAAMYGDKVFSAYMIVYVRRDKVVDLMKPVTDDEIPPHLQDFIKDLQQKEKEAKEKEERERSSFITSSDTYYGFDRPRMNNHWDRFGNFNPHDEEIIDIFFMTEDSFFSNFTKDIIDPNLKAKKYTTKLSAHSTVDDVYKAAEELFNVEEGTIRLWLTTGDCKPYKPFFKVDFSSISENYFVQRKLKDEPRKPPKPLTHTAFVIFFDISLEVPGQYIGSTQMKKNDPISVIFQFTRQKLGLPENADFLTYKEKCGPSPFSLVDPSTQLRERANIVVVELKNHLLLSNSNYIWKTKDDIIQALLPDDSNDENNNIPFFDLIEENRRKMSDAASYFLTNKYYIYIVVYMMDNPDEPRIRIKYSTVFTLSELSDFIALKLNLKYDNKKDSMLLFSSYGDNYRVSDDYLTSLKDVTIRKNYRYFVQLIKGINFESIQNSKLMYVLVALDGFNVSFQTKMYVETDAQAFTIVSKLIKEKVLTDSIVEGTNETEEVNEAEEEVDEIEANGENMFKAMQWFDEGRIRIYKVDNHKISQVWNFDDIIPSKTYEIRVDVVPLNQNELSQNQILVTGCHRQSNYTYLNPFFFVIDFEERVRELKERLRNSIQMEDPWENCSIYLGKVELNASQDPVKIQYILDKSNRNITIFHKI